MILSERRPATGSTTPKSRFERPTPSSRNAARSTIAMVARVARGGAGGRAPCRRRRGRARMTPWGRLPAPEAGRSARRARPRSCALAKRELRRDRADRDGQAVEERRRRSRPRPPISPSFMDERGQPVLRQDDDEPDRQSQRCGRVRTPIGVCAAIMPFNSPLAGIAWKVFPALLCGNAVVVKSHEQTPYTAVALRPAAAGRRPAARPATRVVQGLRRGSRHAARRRTPRVGLVSFTGSVGHGQADSADASASGRCSRKSVSSSAARTRWSSATTPI